MKIKVMTYNIAGGRDYTFYPEKPKYSPSAVSEVIKKYNPDICGLNEVDFGLPRSNKDDLAGVIANNVGGYDHYFAKAVHWEPGDYGNALISRFPMATKEDFLIEDPKDRLEDNYYEPRCILRSTFDLDGKKLHVYVTHFGLPRSEKTAAMSTLFSLLKDETEPCILMGDFNLAPDDGYIKAISTILTDVQTAYKESGKVITYPSQPSIPSTVEGGYKIDYIFVSNHFKVNNVTIPDEKASDHRPYMVELEF